MLFMDFKPPVRGESFKEFVSRVEGSATIFLAHLRVLGARRSWRDGKIAANHLLCRASDTLQSALGGSRNVPDGDGGGGGGGGWTQ